MSLYGMMRTGVSGMNAQANRLSTVADNIANADTTGYKRSSVEFSTMLLPTPGGAYNSGGVNTTVRSAVSAQGALQYTTSVSDLAINGDGFFVVRVPGGNGASADQTNYLTRAGSFVLDAQGRLVNAAGYQLMGYGVDGSDALVPITIPSTARDPQASTLGRMAGNLPSNADPVTGNLPSSGTVPVEYTSKSSMLVYTDDGTPKMLDIYFSKTNSGDWEVSVFDQSAATPGGPFPYTGGALGTGTLTFDGSGNLTSGGNLSFTVPGGGSFNLDLSNFTQFGSGFSVTDVAANGNTNSTINKIQIGKDGTIFAQYTDGSTAALYKIALADVVSPDRLTGLAGNVYVQSPDSGAVTFHAANEDGLGSIVSGALENSNVDIAEELTNMIAAQRSYTANSKVFQTGSDLMDVLVNLKR
ncbi:flagellar hook protein FlgE [Mesorhizobium sp. SP-1A]|uniref:flagellar hook protein FlgE n=1 Tax=Mesorhizobium sp. SP-1A TaxID=3077840 RepID=UPI0028F74090|nr:flagellar hook protein FlgE [Mesorhizobium sp. SP-1A]